MDPGERRDPIPAPFTLVIFGASGDLPRRKIVPSIWSLHRDGHLPRDFRILGVARTPKTEETFRDEIRRGREIAAEGEEENAANERGDGADTESGGDLGSEESVEETAADATEDESTTAVDPEHPPCPDCGNGLDWVQEYDRWYCYSCEKYPW